MNFEEFEEDKDWYKAGFRFVDWYDNKETRTFVISDGLLKLLMCDLGNSHCRFLCVLPN